MSEIYHFINLAIARNEVDATKEYLDKVPLEDMSIEATDTLLQNWLLIAHRNNAGEVATYLLEEFDTLQPNDDQTLSSFTRLFGFPSLPMSTLKWVISVVDPESYIFVIDELVKFDASDELIPSYQRATDLFEINDADTFKECLVLSTSADNSVGIWFFEGKLATVSEYADIPTYVKNFIDGDVPIYTELKIPEIKFEPPALPTISEAVNLLTGGLGETGMDDTEVQKIREKLRSELEAKTDTELYDLVKPLLLNVQLFELKDNKELFHLLGPVNPEYGADLTFDHICYKYGGHSMMYCTCYEINDDDDTPRSSWFTGSCVQCLKRIKSRAHAVRRPKITGGFRSCFCSIQCVKDNLVEVDVLTTLMLDQMERQLNTIQLQDRTEKEGEDLPLPEDSAEVVPGYSADY
jgi:hypothetical protein